MDCPRAAPNRGGRVPLIRTPRTLPRVVDPDEADALLGALRTHRDRAMVQAMLLGGLRRCEVLGLRLGGRAARASVGCSSPRARAAISGSCRSRRGSSPPWRLPGPGTARESSTDQRCSSRCKGPRRGRPLSRGRAGRDPRRRPAARRAEHLTCHQLRHTCFTRLREAGMALEAIQAQAGHRSIESTRIYLHLANDWLAERIPASCRGDRRAGRRGAAMPRAVCGHRVDAPSRRTLVSPTMRPARGRRMCADPPRLTARPCQAQFSRAGGWGELTRAAQSTSSTRPARSSPG